MFNWQSFQCIYYQFVQESNLCWQNLTGICLILQNAVSSSSSANSYQTHTTLKQIISPMYQSKGFQHVAKLIPSCFCSSNVSVFLLQKVLASWYKIPFSHCIHPRRCKTNCLSVKVYGHTHVHIHTCVLTHTQHQSGS